MDNEVEQAKSLLESAGLHVCISGPAWFSVYATAVDAGPGVTLSRDQTTVCRSKGQWTAVFPAPGQCTYEVQETFDALLDLIHVVYTDYRERGGTLSDAFLRRVPDSQKYLRGADPSPLPCANAVVGRERESGTLR